MEPSMREALAAQLALGQQLRVRVEGRRGSGSEEGSGDDDRCVLRWGEGLFGIAWVQPCSFGWTSSQCLCLRVTSTQHVDLAPAAQLGAQLMLVRRCVCVACLLVLA
jgi:hypothetical protein